VWNQHVNANLITNILALFVLAHYAPPIVIVKHMIVIESVLLDIAIVNITINQIIIVKNANINAHLIHNAPLMKYATKVHVCAILVIEEVLLDLVITMVATGTQTVGLICAILIHIVLMVPAIVITIIIEIQPLNYVIIHARRLGFGPGFSFSFLLLLL